MLTVTDFKFLLYRVSIFKWRLFQAVRARFSDADVNYGIAILFSSFWVLGKDRRTIWWYFHEIRKMLASVPSYESTPITTSLRGMPKISAKVKPNEIAYDPEKLPMEIGRSRPINVPTSAFEQKMFNKVRRYERLDSWLTRIKLVRACELESECIRWARGWMCIRWARGWIPTKESCSHHSSWTFIFIPLRRKVQIIYIHSMEAVPSIFLLFSGIIFCVQYVITVMLWLFSPIERSKCAKMWCQSFKLITCRQQSRPE